MCAVPLSFRLVYPSSCVASARCPIDLDKPLACSFLGLAPRRLAWALMYLRLFFSRSCIELDWLVLSVRCEVDYSPFPSPPQHIHHDRRRHRAQRQRVNDHNYQLQRQRPPSASYQLQPLLGAPVSHLRSTMQRYPPPSSSQTFSPYQDSRSSNAMHLFNTHSPSPPEQHQQHLLSTSSPSNGHGIAGASGRPDRPFPRIPRAQLALITLSIPSMTSSGLGRRRARWNSSPSRRPTRKTTIHTKGRLTRSPTNKIISITVMASILPQTPMDTRGLCHRPRESIPPRVARPHLPQIQTRMASIQALAFPHLLRHSLHFHRL